MWNSIHKCNQATYMLHIYHKIELECRKKKILAFLIVMGFRPGVAKTIMPSLRSHSEPWILACSALVIKLAKRLPIKRWSDCPDV